MYICNTKFGVLYHLTKFETITRFVHTKTKKKLSCKVDRVKYLEEVN